MNRATLPEEDHKQYLSLLEEAITESSNNKLWAKYANKLTHSFKSSALESKVSNLFQHILIALTHAYTHMHTHL